MQRQLARGETVGAGSPRPGPRLRQCGGHPHARHAAGDARQHPRAGRPAARSAAVSNGPGGADPPGRQRTPAGYRRAPVRLRGRAGRVEAMVDAARIQRVLENLLSNAVKYSPTGGAIRVSLSTTADETLRPDRGAATQAWAFRRPSSRACSTGSFAAPMSSAASLATGWGWRGPARWSSCTMARSPCTATKAAAVHSPYICHSAADNSMATGARSADWSTITASDRACVLLRMGKSLALEAS